MSQQVQIVLDSDVIIHFIKGNCLSILPKILPQYKYVILSIVYDRELSRDSSTKAQIDNQIRLLKNIQIIPWKPDSNIIKEFARLNKTKGTGESACLAYCKFHNNVLASSNLKDTKEYCRTENITYLTTLDFLWYAKKNKVMTEKKNVMILFKRSYQKTVFYQISLSQYTHQPLIFYSIQ